MAVVTTILTTSKSLVSVMMGSYMGGGDSDLVALNPSLVKPMTLKLIYSSLPSQALHIITIGQGLAGSASG